VSVGPTGLSPPPGYSLRGKLLPSSMEKPTPVPGSQDEASARRTAQNAFLSQVEDGALAAGGLLAAVASGLGSTGYVVLALVVAAVGKSLPSVVRELRDFRVRLPLRKDGDPTHTSGSPSPAPAPNLRPDDPAGWGRFSTHAAGALGDGLLLALAAMGGLLYLGKSGSSWALGFLGAAFIAKAIVDLVEDAIIASNPSDPRFKSTAGTNASRGTESMLFLLFGLAALLLVISPPTAASPAASYALSLAALGKALPSIATSKGSGGGSAQASSASPAFDLYEAPPPGG